MTFSNAAQLTLAAAPSGSDAAVVVGCTGAWTLDEVAELERRMQTLSWPAQRDVVVDGSALTALDTSGAWMLCRLARELEHAGCDVRFTGLRPEFRSLQQLIAGREIGSTVPVAEARGWLARLGAHALAGGRGTLGYLSFVGEASVALFRSLAQPRRLRWRVILHNMQSAGVHALPITGFLSFLMGIVIAYQGADQLQRFGANIFVVDLVALAMLRELSPLLTAIIVAGRSGSAFTAQIGTMKVTEEIDALRTIGVAPLDQLVLPKLIALVIVLPLLTVYTDITGVLGGMVMARGKLDISFAMFVDRLDEAIALSSYWTGISKAPVFAMIIALIGCYRGFHVTGSAESVGEQTTMSVVQAIFLVILTDALFSIVFLWLDL
ncbi:MAG: MlaE family lipid ABC transporter permease subunit [Burkholderiales bacterium]